MQGGAEKEDAGVVVVEDMANHHHHHHDAVVTISGASLDDAGAATAAEADQREKRATAVIEEEAAGGGGGDGDGAGGDTCQIADEQPGGAGSPPTTRAVGSSPLHALELAPPAGVLAAIPKQEESAELAMGAAAAGGEPAPEPASPVNDHPPQQSLSPRAAAGAEDSAQYNQVTIRSLGVGARPSSREDADKKLQYALRSNPKRSRRFFDQDYALDGQLVAQAVNNNSQPQVAATISSSCAAAALTSIPASATSSPAPPPAAALKKTSIAATTFTSAFSQDSSEARACTECGKQFPSWKALFGHMRCHPERQWRGIQPPSSSTNPNHIAAAKNNATTRFKDHATSHYTNHKGTSPNQSSRESESENCATRVAACAGTNEGHNVHRHRRHHHQQQLQLELEAEEESDTESIEAAYMNGRDQESPSWMRGKRSRRCRQALRSLQSVVSAAAAAGRVVSVQSNSPPADDCLIGSTDSQMQLQSRTMINRDQELEPAEADDDQDHGRGAGDMGSSREELEEDKMIADHERDMADCLVMLAFAAKRKGADDQQVSECDSGVMLDGMMISRGGRSGGVINGEESGEEMDWEGHMTSSKLTLAGAASVDHKLDGRLIPDHHQFYTHKINPSAGSGPKSRLVAPKSWEQDMEKAGWDIHKKSKFECSTCKKTFRSHQALGGHRASHKKVKGCFARTNTPAANEEDNINMQTNSTVLQADQAEMMMVMQKADQSLQQQQQQQDGTANVNALTLSMNKSSCPRSTEMEPGLHQDHHQYHDIHQFQEAANLDQDQAAMIRIDSRIQLLQCSISCNEKMEDDLMEPADTAMTLSLQGDKPKPQKLRHQTSSCSSSSSIMAAGTLLMHHHHHHHHSHHHQQSSSSQQQVPKIHQCTICHRIFSTGQALGGHKRCHWGGSSSSGGPPDAAVQVMKKGKQESPSTCSGDVTQNAAAANCSLGLSSTINSGCSELMSKRLVRQESGSFNTNTSGWPAMGASMTTDKACELSISRKGSELQADDQAMDKNSSHPQNWTLGGAGPATEPKSSFEFKKISAGAEDQMMNLGVCDIHSASSKKAWFRAELNLCDSSRSSQDVAQGLLAGINHMIASKLTTTSATTTDENDDEQRATALALQSASNSSTGLSIMQLAPPPPPHLLNPINGRSAAAAAATAMKDDLLDLNLPAPVEEDDADPDHTRSYRPL